MKRGHKDFTGLNLFDDAYSYKRPSELIANAIMNALIDSGFTYEQALNWIYNKSYRWFLDGMDHKFEELAYKLVKKEVKEENPASYSYEMDELHQRALNGIKRLHLEDL